MAETTKKPSGATLMTILISLLADQEGVEIKYELEGVKSELASV